MSPTQFVIRCAELNRDLEAALRAGDLAAYDLSLPRRPRSFRRCTAARVKRGTEAPRLVRLGLT